METKTYVGIIGVIVAVFLIGYGFYLDLRAEVYKLPEGSALDTAIKFDDWRKNPEMLRRIGDKISSVGVFATESNPSSRSDHTRYEAFVVDVNGVPNTFAVSADYDDVASKAQWVAKQLGVPLDNPTY